MIKTKAKGEKMNQTEETRNQIAKLIQELFDERFKALDIWVERSEAASNSKHCEVLKLKDHVEQTGKQLCLDVQAIIARPY